MSDDYTSTGIAGADKILGEKGIPRGHSILIAGGPGKRASIRRVSGARGYPAAHRDERRQVNPDVSGRENARTGS
jgi:hypothetical protein